MSELRKNKITIVGAGSVGATTAYACQIRGVAGTLAIYDINAAKVRAEVLDLNHGAPFVPRCQVIGSDDIAVTAKSDVVIITAGAKQKPGQSRLDLAEANVNIMRTLVPQLVEQSPNAILLIVTNPCDVATMAAQEFSGLPRNRVFGSGTVLDSARLRYLLAERTGVSASNVHAYIAGEHGDSEVALWSTASVGSVPLLDWDPAIPGRAPLTREERESIHQQVVNAAYEIIEGKGATWYAIGLAAARIAEAILRDEDRVLPVSSYLDDYYGISDVCLAVPSIVNGSGVACTMEIPMTDEEIAGLRNCAEEVRRTARAAGL